jgi:uncharacterized protein (TIGR03435 family)
MTRVLLHAGIVTVLTCCAWAQTPAFEVVSIKTNNSGSEGDSSKSHDGVFTGTNLSLKWLITRSYGVRNYQVVGPDWLENARFDIAAKPPAGPDEEKQVRAMLQNMLAERFQLTLHRDSRVFPVYGLVVAKGGPKMTAVEDAGKQSTHGHKGQLAAKQLSMARLAEQLGREMDRPVVDMTELKGVFDFTLKWTPEEAQAAKEETKADVETFPPLLTALQEQLGLKLEPKKAPIEVLVIDRIERVPTEN